MSKEVEKVRVGSRIYFATGVLEMDHKTINKAKRTSREWQKAGGAMGDGRLRVASKPPQAPAVAA